MGRQARFIELLVGTFRGIGGCEGGWTGKSRVAGVVGGRGGRSDGSKEGAATIVRLLALLGRGAEGT